LASRIATARVAAAGVTAARIATTRVTTSGIDLRYGSDRYSEQQNYVSHTGG
jgi:hypothetical protein